MHFCQLGSHLKKCVPCFQKRPGRKQGCYDVTGWNVCVPLSKPWSCGKPNAICHGQSHQKKGYYTPSPNGIVYGAPSHFGDPYNVNPFGWMTKHGDCMGTIRNSTNNDRERYSTNMEDSATNLGVHQEHIYSIWSCVKIEEAGTHTWTALSALKLQNS